LLQKLIFLPERNIGIIVSVDSEDGTLVSSLPSFFFLICWVNGNNQASFLCLGMVLTLGFSQILLLIVVIRCHSCSILFNWRFNFQINVEFLSLVSAENFPWLLL